MRQLTFILLSLFVASLVLATWGPRCANGLLGSQAQAAGASALAHDHNDQNHLPPSPEPDHGDLCSSMQLAAALSGTPRPNPAPDPRQGEISFIWAVATVFVVAADLRPMEHTATPPPPLIASDFAAVHARTGRLLI